MIEIRAMIGLISLLLLFGCQGEEQSEYYGSLLESPLGLVLDQSEHIDGWEREDCFSCHVIGNFHLDRFDRESFYDMGEVRATVVEQGLMSCSDCHGNNGVVLARLALKSYGDSHQ